MTPGAGPAVSSCSVPLSGAPIAVEFTRLSHFHRTPAREERGLSWSAGLIVDLRPGGLFETVMVNDADGSMYTMRAAYVASLTRKE